MSTPPYGQPYAFDPDRPQQPLPAPQQQQPPPTMPYPPAAIPHPPGATPYPPLMVGHIAAYGIDPSTGLPLSDKSKLAAGLLQLIPGFLFALGGIGRLYAGHTALGIVQLFATLVGWISFWCGFATLVTFVVFFGCWLWFVIDGIVLLAGRPVDGTGRPLRA
jgi:TM2 domain-containing membrane protein YozV